MASFVDAAAAGSSSEEEDLADFLDDSALVVTPSAHRAVPVSQVPAVDGVLLLSRSLGSTPCCVLCTQHNCGIGGVELRPLTQMRWHHDPVHGVRAAGLQYLLLYQYNV